MSTLNWTWQVTEATEKTRKPCVARKPRSVAAVLFLLKFVDNIHYKFNSSQASGNPREYLMLPGCAILITSRCSGDATSLNLTLKLERLASDRESWSLTCTARLICPQCGRICAFRSDIRTHTKLTSLRQYNVIVEIRLTTARCKQTSNLKQAPLREIDYAGN